MSENMTPEEMKKVLDDMGIPVGRFTKTEARTNIESPIVKRQKKALGEIEKLLSLQLEQEQEKLANAHIALQRLKHGGGS